MLSNVPSICLHHEAEQWLDLIHVQRGDELMTSLLCIGIKLTIFCENIYANSSLYLPSYN